MKFRLALVLLVVLLVPAGSAASAQGPAPTAPPAQGSGVDGVTKLAVIAQTIGDMLQGKPVDPARQLLESAREQSRQLDQSGGSLFFFDFGDPALPLNEFAGQTARTLLVLTPLYVLAYLGLLVFSIWKERPIPNPLLYAALVFGVMFFLAAFAIIAEGMTRVGGVLAGALGGQGGAVTRAGVLDMVIGTLEGMSKSAGLLAAPSLLIALVECLIILVQLLYRGISMAIWRLVGVILIPLSVLLEGVQARTAGRVIGGFFEAWMDIVGKVTLLLVVLAFSGAPGYASLAHLILPAGLLIVIFSWKFVGLGYTMLAEAVGREWRQLAPAAETAMPAPLSPSAERSRAALIDQDRKGLLDE